MDVELREAGREDTPVLQRLMQLYLYDLGTIDGWDVRDDGLYGTAALIEGFWTDPKRRSFLVGVGERAATRVFDMFPGKWELTELTRNVEAQAFWRRVIGRYTGHRFEDVPRPDGKGQMQRFDNSRR